MDESVPATLLVDVAKICPPGITATHFGRLNTLAFVEKCLLALPAGQESRPSYEIELVKITATEIIGLLFHLIMTAKTRSRTNIMKSRKVLEVEEVYGEAHSNITISF